MHKNYKRFVTLEIVKFNHFCDLIRFERQINFEFEPENKCSLRFKIPVVANLRKEWVEEEIDIRQLIIQRFVINGCS